MYGRVLVATLLLSTVGVRCYADDPLDIAANGFKGTCDQILSIHAVVHVDVVRDGKTDCTYQSEWWEEGGKVRWKYGFKSLYETADEKGDKKIVWGDTKSDVLLMDRRGTVLRERSIPDMDGPKVAEVGDMNMADAGLFSLWSKVGFLLNDLPEIKLVDALQSSGWRRSARQIESDGRMLILVEGQSRDSERPSFLAWIDPDHSFLPIRHVVFDYSGSHDERKAYCERRVLRFHSPTKGSDVWFPAETEFRFYVAGERGREPHTEHHIRIDPIQINVPIRPETFQLTIPAGYKVTNHISGQRYTMGSDGEPVSPTPIMEIPIDTQNLRERPRWQIWAWTITGILVLLLSSWLLFKVRARQRAQ
jgi:hypothetical protein